MNLVPPLKEIVEALNCVLGFKSGMSFVMGF